MRVSLPMGRACRQYDDEWGWHAAWPIYWPAHSLPAALCCLPVPQMVKDVPPQAPWRSLMLRHGDLKQRLYYLPGR